MHLVVNMISVCSTMLEIRMIVNLCLMLMRPQSGSECLQEDVGIGRYLCCQSIADFVNPQNEAGTKTMITFDEGNPQLKCKHPKGKNIKFWNLRITGRELTLITGAQWKPLSIPFDLNGKPVPCPTSSTSCQLNLHGIRKLPHDQSVESFGTIAT
jgi:hypothetical protein